MNEHKLTMKNTVFAMIFFYQLYIIRVHYVIHLYLHIIISSYYTYKPYYTTEWLYVHTVLYTPCIFKDMHLIIHSHERLFKC